jgi:hypothetical protein
MAEAPWKSCEYSRLKRIENKCGAQIFFVATPDDGLDPCIQLPIFRSVTISQSAEVSSTLGHGYPT